MPSIILIDSYSEINQDAQESLGNLHPSYTDAKSAAGQSFTCVDGAPLTSVKLYMKKIGSPAGDGHAVLYAHLGTYGGSSRPTGSPLAISDAFDVSTLTTSYQLITFTFTGAQQYEMQDNIYYVIVFECPASGLVDTDNRIYVGCDASSPDHDGNISRFSNGAWGPNANRDACFYVYGGLEELGICDWINAQGGPTSLGIDDVFVIIDSYLFETPPPGYTFVPTLQNMFGVVDYYLGFNGDAATGCDFYFYYGGHDTMIKVGEILYDPTEANLQIAINSLGGSEGTVWLPRFTPITIQNNRLLVAENCRLRGAYGESVLNLLKGIDIQNANNVELSGFKIEGYEGIKIISNTNVSHFVLENIEAYDLSQTTAAPPGLFAIWAQDCTISDITMRNLHAERINCMMIHLSGGGTTDKIKDILIEDCYGKTCGYGIGRDWTTCYDFAEGITYLENMLVRRCHAEDGWENGFHWENLPTKTNVVIEDCTGVNNGWRKPGAEFGSGIWVSGGVTVRNCTCGGNKVRGFTFNNNKAGAVTNIIDCMDDGSTVGIKGEGTGGNTYVTNFETKNNPDYGFYFLLAANLHISNMRVDNSGGTGSYNNLFGSSSYPVTDSELDVIIVNDPVNTHTIYSRNGINLHFTGSIKTHSERALYISTGTNILVEMDIDSTGNSGIRGYGTLTDVYVKNSLIENTEGTPELAYGIYNGGTQIFIEEATVTVRDALVHYYNCTFV